VAQTMSSNTTTNGTTVASEADWSEPKPPASSRAIAAAPSTRGHSMRAHGDGFRAKAVLEYCEPQFVFSCTTWPLVRCPRVLVGHTQLVRNQEEPLVLGVDQQAGFIGSSG
jgi:hypothetical protein